MTTQRRPCMECRYEDVAPDSPLCEGCKNGYSAFVPKFKSVSDGRLKFFGQADEVKKEESDKSARSKK